jgi:hypothetical protein
MATFPTEPSLGRINSDFDLQQCASTVRKCELPVSVPLNPQIVPHEGIRYPAMAQRNTRGGLDIATNVNVWAETNQKATQGGEALRMITPRNLEEVFSCDKCAANTQHQTPPTYRSGSRMRHQHTLRDLCF